MAIRYKIDIMESLKERGYSSYRLRKEKLFGEATLQMYRRGEFVSSKDNLSVLCRLLDAQPGDLIEYLPDDNPAITH